MRNILILMILISGLIVTSFIKNKSRLLEKELTKLNNEIIVLNSNIAEATLDYEYLTTPKNISFLASNFLDEYFSYYKSYQIDHLNVQKNDSFNLNKPMKHEDFDQLVLKKTINKDSYIKKTINKDSYIAKEINYKQLFIKKEINNKKKSKSQNIIDSEKTKKWTVLQMIKAIFGIPIVPLK